jgi:NAD(P)-dependent dehydrogenase (short-subunit alcohol dehydrogenase family)
MSVNEAAEAPAAPRVLKLQGLASDDADYVTGQSFTIDGGLEMNWWQGA